MPKDYNLAGTMPDDGNGLTAIRKFLVEQPRRRHWAIVELHNMRTILDHPDDDDDHPNPIIRLDTLVAVTIPDDLITLQEIIARARSNTPGQGTMEDEMAAQRAKHENGGEQ